MKERRTIMSALDYSIASLQNIKKQLCASDAKNPELNWAVGGIIITLSANLLRISQDTIANSVEKNKMDAKENLLEIKYEFNEFIHKMVCHE